MSDSVGSILLVDDDPLYRAKLRRHLEPQNFSLTEAENGNQALELLDRRRFDLMLLDIKMLGLSGLEVLKAVRQKYSMTDLPVIMATAANEGSAVVLALSEGANDYVTKPFDLPVVLARVQTQLALKRAVDRSTLLEKSLAQRNAELEEANAQLAKANRLMKLDLQAAARVQKALLPPASLHVGGATFAWKYDPCVELGGDLLNVLALDERRVCLYLLDVAGHGVKAALLAVMVSRFLSRLHYSRVPSLRTASEPHPTPAEVAAHLSREFPWDEQTEQFFTLLHGVLDLESGEFRYVVAGHPGPLHLSRDGEATIHSTPSPGIGMPNDDNESPQERRIILNKGDRLFLFSDGLIDAMNPTRNYSDRRFGESRLQQVLQESRSLALPASLDRLTQALREWCAPGSPHDDVSVLALEST